MANIQMTGPTAGSVHIGAKDYKPAAGGVYTIPEELLGAAMKCGLKPMAATTKAGAPVAGVDLAPGQSGIFKDSGGGSVKLYYNDAGTLRSVTLT